MADAYPQCNAVIEGCSRNYPLLTVKHIMDVHLNTGYIDFGDHTLVLYGRWEGKKLVTGRNYGLKRQKFDLPDPLLVARSITLIDDRLYVAESFMENRDYVKILKGIANINRRALQLEGSLEDIAEKWINVRPRHVLLDG
ncbi:MAG: hypothetical protein ACE5FT_03320 [Candidatus Nanoarchaeia archaeon]